MHKVMISSTSFDLPKHREATLDAILRANMSPLDMKHATAMSDPDAISFSLGMVEKADIYVGIFAERYGYVPKDPRNPLEVSVTELEYRRAVERKLPILIFVADKTHPFTTDQIEFTPTSREKLEKLKNELTTKYIVAFYKSPEELHSRVLQALNEYESKHKKKEPSPLPQKRDDAIPIPPAFYAEPDYIGSHRFFGRESQLQELSDWANRSNPTNLLLYEAIGGNGKSMLTWHWAKDEQGRYAMQARPDWAGRFWYSFYERGAIMQDFCQRALAYMTVRPLKEFEKRKTAEMKDELIAQLHARPWLLILDGLERVLVAYHRIDAAELPDEEANAPTDKILNRNPCNAIRDEDTDLLRALAACSPSKILVSSRLTPRVLLNAANQPIPGVRRVTLPGLRPPDAEQLLRSCGITGESAAIQAYLQENCDNHPLVIGILAGLITNYLPDRGNFDYWSNDPNAGGQLNLAELDLIQRRNHILKHALAALPEKGQELLGTLALISESVDYPTLVAINPHLPPEPAVVFEPLKPEKMQDWNGLSVEQKKKRIKQYKTEMVRWKNYSFEVNARLMSSELLSADKKLSQTIHDLQQRGLLHYDSHSHRYDMHPVVRGVELGSLRAEEKKQYGQRAVDYFSSISHRPYAEVETLEDVKNDLNIIRTLVKMGRLKEAINSITLDLGCALAYNLEAHYEILSLLRPFFPVSWGEVLEDIDENKKAFLYNDAANALGQISEDSTALLAYDSALRLSLKKNDWKTVKALLVNITHNLSAVRLFAKSERILTLLVQLARLDSNLELMFVAEQARFNYLVRSGFMVEASKSWEHIKNMGRNWDRGFYRPGNAETDYAWYKYVSAELSEEHLRTAEILAKKGKNRPAIRFLHSLRGNWLMDRMDWESAEKSLREALRMSRESGVQDAADETSLSLVTFHLGKLLEPHAEAERLGQLRNPDYEGLAMLWQVIGDLEQAKKYSIAAYKWAWADGEPYVHRYKLSKSTELLHSLNVPIPQLPPYDPSKDEPFPWEADVRAAIEKLRKEKEEKKSNGDGESGS